MAKNKCKRCPRTFDNRSLLNDHQIRHIKKSLYKPRRKEKKTLLGTIKGFFLGQGDILARKHFFREVNN